MPESGKKTTTVATENSNSQVNTVPVQNQSAPDKSVDNNTTQNQEQSTTQEPKANLELLKQRLYDTVAAIFSRCGVPTANFRISDLVEFSASVSYSMNWNFKCRCSDKILRSVSDETHVLSTSALDEFTLANTKELEKDSAKTKEFVKHLSVASFEDLKALSGQIICFNRINAIGKTRCKNCHGSGSSICENCGGKGTIECPTCHGSAKACPVCHGSGNAKCHTCNGTGKVKCKDCQGKGEVTVDREVIYDADCKKQISISLMVPGTDKKITSFSKEDEKAIIEAADFSGKPNGNETARGYSVNFLGTAPCYAVHVYLVGVEKPFDFIICGHKNLRSICKPPVLDYVFNDESHLLSDTLIASADDVDEKIKCVKALASKAILAKTIRTIERHEMEIAKEQAVAQGVTVESILTAAKHKDSSRLIYIKTKVKQELLDSITKELTDNAHGYISEDFARVFAKNLISFVPLLMVLNPKTKIIWAGITLVTWMIVILIGYMVPNIVGGIMMMCVSSIICAFTSFALTKNWSYYSAVSMLKLTHRLKKVPSLTVEAVQSIRLILGTVVIGLLTILIVNGHFL